MKPVGELLDDAVQRLFAPQPIVRLEVVRILAPIAMLIFFASRVVHPDDWLSAAGFRIPQLDHDYHQAVYFSPLSPFAARVACGLVVACCIAVAVGAGTRWAALVLAVVLAYAALADRSESFTVSKISPIFALALALSPAGARWSVDAWWRRRRDPRHQPPTLVSAGCVRFFQLWLIVFYFSSGLAKAHGDWLSDPYVLWSHLHDSYQTPVSWFFANHLPTFGWTIMQATTIAFELGAPLWFALRWTRPFALAYGVLMHAMIGMMFGPLAGFSLLMMSLLVASFAPVTLLDPTRVRSPAAKQVAR